MCRLWDQVHFATLKKFGIWSNLHILDVLHIHETSPLVKSKAWKIFIADQHLLSILSGSTCTKYTVCLNLCVISQYLCERLQCLKCVNNKIKPYQKHQYFMVHNLCISEVLQNYCAHIWDVNLYEWDMLHIWMRY